MGEKAGFLKRVWGKITGNPVTVESDEFYGGNPRNAAKKDYNCYEFASGKITFDGKVPTVGAYGGKPFFPIENCPYTFQESMEADGFIKATKHDIVANGQPKPKEGYNLVAAYYTTPESPLKDCHFLRQDKDGNWQHKLGAKYGVSSLDLSQRKIIDPAKANFDFVDSKGVKQLDHEFRGYFYVPKEGVDTSREFGLGNLKPPIAKQNMGPDKLMEAVLNYAPSR